jgi:hypothetical protein
VTSEQALAILRFTVPGFVFLKLLYIISLRTNRTDLEWATWSLAASVPIGAAAAFLYPTNDYGRDLVAVGIAMLGGLALGFGWLLFTQRFPRARESLSSTAWDAILSQSYWVEVETLKGGRWMGQLAVTAESGATAKPDLYLRKPAEFVDEDFVDRDDLDGFWIAANQVASIKVYAREDEADPKEAQDAKAETAVHPKTSPEANR